MHSVKKFFRKLIDRAVYGASCDSDSLVRYLRNLGASIGERVCFFDAKNTIVDTTRPWMIEIGNDVQITSGVKILTHGYDWSVIKGKYSEILGSSGKVKIGNNVFIGVNTIILKGTSIGNNVIIGGGSVVTSTIPDNSVAVGNPARVISSLEEYYEKRRHVQVQEASELVREYRRKYDKNPGPEEMAEFFWLFVGKGDKYESLPVSWKMKMKLMGNEELSVLRLMEHQKEYENMDAFFDSI